MYIIVCADYFYRCFKESDFKWNSRCLFFCSESNALMYTVFVNNAIRPLKSIKYNKPVNGKKSHFQL